MWVVVSACTLSPVRGTAEPISGGCELRLPFAHLHDPSQCYIVYGFAIYGSSNPATARRGRSGTGVSGFFRAASSGQLWEDEGAERADAGRQMGWPHSSGRPSKSTRRSFAARTRQGQACRLLHARPRSPSSSATPFRSFPVRTFPRLPSSPTLHPTSATSTSAQLSVLGPLARPLPSAKLTRECRRHALRRLPAHRLADRGHTKHERRAWRQLLLLPPRDPPAKPMTSE